MGRGKSKVVMMACGNFRNHVLRKTCGRELLALVPSIECSKEQAQLKVVSAARRTILHRCMEHILGSIKVRNIAIVRSLITICEWWINSHVYVLLTVDFIF